MDQSTHFGPWPNRIIATMRATITSKLGEPVTFYVEHLDLYRFHGDQYQATLQYYFREKYRGKPIGLMVVIGTTAFEYAVKLRDALWPAVQIVFAAVEKDTVLGNIPSGVTGITMEMTLADMMRAAQIVVPGLHSFAVVGTPLDKQVYYRHFSEELPRFSTEFDFIDLTGLSIPEVRRRVSTLPDHSAIFYIGINFYQQTSYVAAEVVPLIAEVANRPIIINAETFLGTGAVGGFILTPEQIGTEAGQLASRVLGGENAGAIPVTDGSPPRPIFDWRQLQRWNVSEATLPVGSEIRFRPPDLLRRYRAQILVACGALLAQAALITWLLYEHRRRHLAEVKSRAALSELSHVNRVALAGELSASIAHEIKQPLTGIATRASAALRWLAADSPDIAKARTALQQIESASHRTSAIIDGVRSMFYKDSVAKKPVDINASILAALSLVRIELESHKIEVRTYLDNTIPKATGDYVQLQQVILNLVMNARDAMSSVPPPRLLKINSGSNGNEILVSIEDCGAGIDAADLERIFDPLFTTKTGGMGMGLAICRSIISDHNGRIWATGGEHGGSTFHLALPVPKSDRGTWRGLADSGLLSSAL